jgi:hypothetical protein
MVPGAAIAGLVAGSCSAAGGSESAVSDHGRRIIASTRVSALNSGSDRSDDGSGLFDDSVVHDIEVTFRQGEYDAMIATFNSSGDKEWLTRLHHHRRRDP